MRVSIDRGHEHFPVTVDLLSIKKTKDGEQTHVAIALTGTDENGAEVILNINIPNQDGELIGNAADTEEDEISVRLTPMPDEAKEVLESKPQEYSI